MFVVIERDHSFIAHKIFFRKINISYQEVRSVNFFENIACVLNEDPKAYRIYQKSIFQETSLLIHSCRYC